MPTIAHLSAKLPASLVSESQTKTTIRGIISQIKSTTDIDKKGELLAKLTHEIDNLKRLKDAILAANQEGIDLKAKLVQAQIDGKALTLPTVIQFLGTNTMHSGASPQEVIDAFKVELNFIPTSTSTFAEITAKIQSIEGIVQRVKDANAQVTK
ncbi:MAG: hypothetical protein KAH32_01025, partial [Chlamydiia bacterium]|nr:hypothetical protein [Chlamydiia bacterium]